MSYAISLTMGAILGFAAHRAGLCTVKAVSEIVTARRAHILWSFGKSALWVVVVTALASTVVDDATLRHWPLTVNAVAGGVLFGLGAGLNRACAFSTMSRLADGHLDMLATVAGWIVGLAAALHLFDRMSSRPEAMPGVGLALNGVVVVLLMLWALWELWRLMRRLSRGRSAAQIIGAPIYTLSAGAALVGVSHAVMVLSSGPWSFTGAMLCGMDAATLANRHDPLLPWLIFLVALCGMIVSSVQRKSFGLRRPRLRPVLRHRGAGVMMGIGAALIPGGNDGLILFGMPAFSPHAFPAYGGILAGILAPMLVMKALRRPVPAFFCDNDICRAQR